MKYIKNILADFHRKMSRDQRTSVLAPILSNLIQLSSSKSSIKCLDIGCGDMSLSEKITNHFGSTISLSWTSLDLFTPPEDSKDILKWQKYHQYNGKNIDFPNNYFDVALLIDVLHHDFENAPEIISEARRVAKEVIIKDHFEYGLFSRICLILLDFFGNYAYDVSLPKRYFDEKTFNDLLVQQNLHLVCLKKGIHLYDHLPLLKSILKSKWQFVATIH